MKRLLLLLPFALAACDGTATTAPVAPSYSSANSPARYQVSTTTYVANVLFGTYIHTFVLTTNPCDGSMSMTASLVSNDGFQPNTTETITSFSIDPTTHVLSFHAVYDDPFYSGYNYDAAFDGSTYVGAGAGSVQTTKTVTTTNYKNHGDFVSANPSKNDAAHSCIGMPIVN